MANQFVAIPAPAANGSGAAVDVSTFGALKTVTVTPNGGVFTPFVTIEASIENAPVHWFAIETLQNGDATFTNAVHWIRATVSNYKGGGAPTVELGGTDDGSDFAELAVLAGNGPGAGTDVSALGLLKTVQVAGPFGGVVNVEVSEDGGATYQTAFSFNAPGAQNLEIAADFMRASRGGVPLVAPGLPDVWVGATTPAGGGGGGVIVQQEGVDVDNPATAINFRNFGMLAEDGGAGVAEVWGTLLPVTDIFHPAEASTVICVQGRTNVIEPTNSATARLPSAAATPNGVHCVVKLVSTTLDDGDATGPVSIGTTGGDTADLYPNGAFPATLAVVGASFMFVSDGVSDWNLVAAWNPTTTTPTEQAFHQPVNAGTTPNSFSVAFPTDFAVAEAANLVIQVTLQPPTVDDVVGVFILSYDESQVTLGATSNFANGSTLHISARVKTGGP